MLIVTIHYDSPVQAVINYCLLLHFPHFPHLHQYSQQVTLDIICHLLLMFSTSGMMANELLASPCLANCCCYVASLFGASMVETCCDSSIFYPTLSLAIFVQLCHLMIKGT